VDNFRRLRFKIFLLVALPPLLVAGLVIWAFWSSGEEQTVTVLEDGVAIVTAPLPKALDLVEERIGFRPVVPSRIPLDGLTLFQIDSFLPQGEGGKPPVSIVLFLEPNIPEPRLVRVGQSALFDGAVPSDARSLNIGVNGVAVWAVTDPFPRFLIVSGGVLVSTQVVSDPFVTDRDALPMLRSIAKQLKK
jgi:hypothetical protein